MYTYTMWPMVPAGIDWVQVGITAVIAIISIWMVWAAVNDNGKTDGGLMSAFLGFFGICLFVVSIFLAYLTYGNYKDKNRDFENVKFVGKLEKIFAGGGKSTHLYATYFADDRHITFEICDECGYHDNILIYRNTK